MAAVLHSVHGTEEGLAVHKIVAYRKGSE
jgi:hypothetical protein